MNGCISISAAVEGPVDQAVVSKLAEYTDIAVGRTFGKNGKGGLRRRIRGYNTAANHRPWIVLVDLDLDEDCAPPFCRAWLPNPSRLMCFRVAVRAVEAWLLADRERIARFLSVGKGRVPADPEILNNPKEAMVNLARRSRRKDIF